MSWTYWPAVSGDDIQLWDRLIELWFALRERSAVAANSANTLNSFPPNNGWFTAFISTATDNGDGTITLTFSPVNWDVDTAAGCGPQRWVGYGCPTQSCPPSYIPSSYDAVIEPDLFNPLQTVRGHIQTEVYTQGTHTAGSVIIDGSNVLDAITAGFIPNVAYLAGKACTFVRAGSGLASTERLPTQPTDRPLWIGTSSTGGDAYWPAGSDSHTGTHYSIIQDTTAPGVPLQQGMGNWPTDQWAGKEVLIYGGGKLNRLTIAHNTSDTLYVAYSATTTYSGAFGIVAAGAKYMPGRDAWRPYQFYTGLANQTVTHLADDSIGTWPEAAGSMQWAEGNPCVGTPCDQAGHDVFDFDAQIEIDNLCETGRAGNFVAPHYWFSLRSLQNQVIAIAPSFLVKGYNPEAARCIHLYTPAQVFLDAGCDGGTSALVDDGGGNWHFNVDAAYNGKTVFYTIWPNTSCNPVTGTATVSGGQVGPLTGSFVEPGKCVATDDTGSTVYYSPGWTRFKAREVQYLFGKNIFIPDTSAPPSCYPTVADPPAVNFAKDADCNVIVPHTYDCFGRGAWYTHQASTAYLERGVSAVSQGEAFVEGEFVRYVGDNAADPFDNPGGDYDKAYWDRFYRGTYGPALQSERDGNKTGSVDSATTYSITANSPRNFWSDGVSTGVLRTETGTATGGSTTTLTDSTKDTTTNTLPWGCWYDAGRFNGATPLAGFILEITHAGAVYKVPIANCTFGAGGVTYTFAAVAGLTVASGDTYQVREPAYERDTWAGRRLKITHADGSDDSYYWIRHNDDTTLYVDAQAGAIAARGDGFEIIEPQFGTVWKWTATAPAGGVSDTTWWPCGSGYVVKPTGTDHTRVGVTSPANFLDDQTADLQSWAKAYGPIMPGDAICNETLNQLYTAIDNLRRTKISGTWQHHVSGEITYADCYATFDGEFDCLSDVDARVQASWGGAPGGATWTATADVDNAPCAVKDCECDFILNTDKTTWACSNSTVDEIKQAGYLHCTINSAFIGASVDYLLYTDLNTDGCSDAHYYDTNGDNVSASIRTWHVFDTATFAAGGDGAAPIDLWSARVGDTSTAPVGPVYGDLHGTMSYTGLVGNGNIDGGVDYHVPYGTPGLQFDACTSTTGLGFQCLFYSWVVDGSGNLSDSMNTVGIADTGTDLKVSTEFSGLDPTTIPASGTLWFDWVSQPETGYRVTDQCAILTWDFTYVS